MTEPSTRLTLRPLANPAPLGIYSFGIGMVLLAAQTAGWVPAGQAKQVGILLAAFVFPLELLATIFAFLSRDTLAGTILGLFTTSWFSLGLSLIFGQPGAPDRTDAFYLLAFTAPVIVLAVIASTGKPLFTLLLGLSAARALLDGLYNASGTVSLEHAAGYVAAGIAGISLYVGSAFLLEDVRGRALLPVFRRGGLPPGEAGVRPQL